MKRAREADLGSEEAPENSSSHVSSVADDEDVVIQRKKDRNIRFFLILKMGFVHMNIRPF